MVPLNWEKKYSEWITDKVVSNFNWLSSKSGGEALSKVFHFQPLLDSFENLIFTSCSCRLLNACVLYVGVLHQKHVCLVQNILCRVCHVSPFHWLMRESQTFEKLCSFGFECLLTGGTTFVYTDVLSPQFVSKEWSNQCELHVSVVTVLLKCQWVTNPSNQCPVDINVVGERLFIVSLG